MVLVPVPQTGQSVARELTSGALVVFRGPGLISVVAAAAVLTAILAIPIAGIWCSIIALTLAASVYGEIMHRVSRGTSAVPNLSWKATLIPRSVLKWLLCVLMAMGIVFPLWLLNVGFRKSPHLDWVGRSILAATWILLPLLMLVAYGRDGDRPLGFKGCLGRLVRHPLAVVLGIAVVPTIVTLLEFSIGLIFYMVGSLPFFALEFMPMPRIPDPPVMIQDIPYYGLVDYRSHPESKFVAGYFDGLKHGYSFIGAIPASLSRETRAGLNTHVHGLVPFEYFIARLLIVFALLAFILTAFAIQARVLGAILGLDRSRPTEPVANL